MLAILYSANQAADRYNMQFECHTCNRLNASTVYNHLHDVLVQVACFFSTQCLVWYEAVTCINSNSSNYLLSLPMHTCIINNA